MAEITDLDTTDANNTGRWPENMPFANVNNAGRADEGLLARWFKDWNGSIVASGSAGAYAITSNRTIASLANNTLMWFRANHTNTGAATLNLNGIGIKDIVRATGSALTAGDITSGQIVGVYFNSSLDDWVLITPAVQGSASDTATGLIELAIQSEMETATDVARAVTPGRQHFHPGHPKFWGYVTVSGGTPTLQTSYNLTSITDEGTGDLTATIATDFADAEWASFAMGGDSDGRPVVVTAKAAGSVRLLYKVFGAVATDPTEWSFQGLGDLA